MSSVGLMYGGEFIHQLDIGCLGSQGLMWPCDTIISYYGCVQQHVIKI